MSDVLVEVAPSERISIQARQYEIDTDGIQVELVQYSQIATIRKVDRITVTATAKGPSGDRGLTGPGVPSGGSSGMVLAKKSEADNDTEWRPIVMYGTGDPPNPDGIQDGALYFKLST